MAEKLVKPYTEEERFMFISKYNHQMAMDIQETDKALFALFPNEILVDGKPSVDPGYQDKQNKLEKERIAKLSLRRGDVFRGLLKAKGITKSQIRSFIDSMPSKTEEEKLTKELALIDFEDALEFFRGNELVNIIGSHFNISSESLTAFFESNDYRFLRSKEDITNLKEESYG